MICCAVFLCTVHWYKTSTIMFIARAILAKIRPQRLSPRNIQDQLDFTRAAVLTSTYAFAQQQKASCDNSVSPIPSKGFREREKQISARKPLTNKRAAQREMNEQMVTYFNIVHAAQAASPPLRDGAIGSRSVESHSDHSGDGPSPSPPSLQKVEDNEAERSADRKHAETWRRQLLREMLQSELGFHTVVKKSGISGAGLGLFVEGSAPEGSIVAIYPGFVHLPEYLQNEKYQALLLPDEQHFLMGRADGCIVDGRTAGLLPSSPLAFAHAVNHPPAGRAANVLQVAYDFPVLGENDLGIAKGGRFPEHLRPLVPNRYNRPPKAVFGGKLDLSAMVETVVLLACRGGLHDEEIFMDYRFNPKMPHPAWYSPVDPQATTKMWTPDDRCTTSQSLFKVPWFRQPK